MPRNRINLPTLGLMLSLITFTTMSVDSFKASRPTSVEKEHSFQVHFMFRVEPGRKIWVDGDLANCLALRVHLQVLCWISEYSEQRRSDKMSRNQKT